MHVTFISRDTEGRQWRDVAVRRVQFAMRRLSWIAPRARVQLSDINGPRGGVDKRCRIQLKTQGGGTVVITSLARDWRSALDTALDRAAHAVLRLWRRGHRENSRRAASRSALAFDR
jgi:ribosome-associated translation inhibitor RaiA